jgi:uncharacterized protein (TIGR00255 family)
VITSMTGYGSGEANRNGTCVRVELRSVNHRNLDISMRLPRALAGQESLLRETLSSRLSRGRISVTVDLERSAEATLVLDEGVLDQVRGIFDQLREHFGAREADTASLFQIPDLVRRVPVEDAPGLAEEALAEAADSALKELIAMRTAEGEALARDLSSRLRRASEVTDEIASRVRGAPVRHRQKLEERIAGLTPEGMEPDPVRLATEVALFAEKSDVTEEIVRLRAHLDAFGEFLNRTEPVGRRMDFLLQEMNREVNTIGSKAPDAAVARCVVDLKEEVERLREQVQNIE